MAWEVVRKGSDITLGVGKLPDRKQVALYLTDGPVIYTLAYFRTEDQAERFVAWLKEIFPGGTE